jgi:hypothetical protein
MTRRAACTGRVSLLPRHEVKRLPPDERAAVEMLEAHLWHRQHTDHPALELLPDGTLGVFLTIGHVQKLLRQIGAHKHGEDYAAAVLNEHLPRLGLIEHTTRVKKPRVEPSRFGKNTDPRSEGGRGAQPDEQHSYWWRVFRLPTLTRYVTPLAGAYRVHEFWGARLGPASLVGLLRCQLLIPARRRRRGFAHGSVQAAFWATGPP